MDLAPIVLFTYNRPWHTEQTLNALMVNELADKSTLYIYCDGPKKGATKHELSKIKEVRDLVKQKKWCNKVNITEYQTNQGLAKSILSGVTTVIQEYGKIIVLEDDIVTNKHFLSYMNFSLNYYKDTENVYHINGYNNESNLQFILDDYYFLHFMFCWGWATWVEKWNKLEKDYQVFYDKFTNNDKLLSKFNYGNKMRFQDQLAENLKNNINTWAVLWNCTIFFNNAYCLTSKKSYVLNIGLDGTGEHCENTNIYQNEISDGIIPFKGGIQIVEKLRSRLHLKFFFSFGKYFKPHKFLLGIIKNIFK